MRKLISIVEGLDDPTVLFHCSPLTNLASVAEHGLSPEYSKWSAAVYLAGNEEHARGYGTMHRQTASVMFAITVSKLDPSQLGPDDVDLPDALGDPDEWENYDWKDSLRICGQCCYKGNIHPSAIRYWDGERWENISDDD